MGGDCLDDFYQALAHHIVSFRGAGTQEGHHITLLGLVTLLDMMTEDFWRVVTAWRTYQTHTTPHF